MTDEFAEQGHGFTSCHLADAVMFFVPTRSLLLFYIFRICKKIVWASTKQSSSLFLLFISAQSI